MRNHFIFIISLALSLQTKAQTTIIDIDGNTYSTVTIGEQVWMKENLRVTMLNNGTEIPNITSPSSWDNLTTPSYAWYDNDNETYESTKTGVLYNWYTIETERLCPVNWHVPSKEEWDELENYLVDNGYAVDNNISKIAASLASKSGWRTGASNTGSPGYDTAINNRSGFTAIPNGLRDNMGGAFLEIESSANWWSSSAIDSLNTAWQYAIRRDDGRLSDIYQSDKAAGLGVRCLQNNSQTVTDIDGNIYNTVTIGEQVWMAENLRVTHYAEGTAIPKIVDNSEWANLGDNNTEKAYCWYDNDSSRYAQTYGALYSWAAAINGSTTEITQGACPTDWHLPNEAEWQELVEYLIANGYNYDGTTSDNKIAKALAANERWMESSAIGHVGYEPQDNNSTGFSALPSGYRTSNYGGFSNGEKGGYWWSNTAYSATESHIRHIWYNDLDLDQFQMEKSYGFGIRCVKNNTYSTASSFQTENAEIKLYPNPAQNTLFLKGNIQSSATITIFNLQGKQVLNSRINSNNIEISKLPAGIYMVRIMNGQKISVSKFIKE